MTDKTDSKEREAFEAWYCDQMRAAGYNADEGIAQLREGNHYGKERVMLNGKWEGWQARASLAASAGSEPVAQLAAERDELFQAAIDFIRTLTGMEPPPIEVAPPEVFAPFHAFVNTIQAITNKRNSPPREGMVMVPKEPTHHMLNAAASAYEDARQSLGAYNAPWAAYRAMLEVAAPPTSSADSRKGE
jgi:hypothetical protein